MRSLFPLALAACGRLGFDDVAATTPSDAVADGLVDAAGTPDLCNPATGGGIPFATGESAVKLRATPLSAGHAVAVQTSLDQTYMVRVDATGAVVATTLPFTPGYTLQGISQLDDRPFVYVHSGGVGYIKLLLPDWASYDTGPSGEPGDADPQQARLAGTNTALFGTFSTGMLALGTIDANNNQTAITDPTPFAAFASFGSTPTGVRVVVQGDMQICDTFEISSDGAIGPHHTFSPCVEPRLATLGTGGGIVHRTSAGGMIAVHRIPPVSTDPGTTKLLEDGTNVRIAAIDGAIWVGYLRQDGTLRLVRFVDDVVTTRDLPTVTSSFDLTPSGAFWITGDGELHTAQPCL